MKDYPYLYAPNLYDATHPITNFFENTYCASSCPGQTGDEVCYAEVDATQVCTTSAADTYETTEILNYCIPSASALAAQSVNSSNDDFTTDNFFMAMYESRWAIFTCIWIALVLALIYIKLMDWCAKPIAWVTIFVIEAALITMGYFSYDYAQSVITANNNERNSTSAGALGMASVLWILAGLFGLMMICNWKSLRISIAIIDTAADFFADTKRIVFMPLLYFSVWVCIFIFWLWGLTGVASITED